MKFLIFVIISTILLLKINSSGDSKVLQLTTSDFQKTLDDNELVLVKFYAPWCGHCKKFAPAYDEASITLDGESVLAKVDCTVEKEVCDEQGVQGFPTIKLFRKGVASEYDSARTAEAVVNFMRRQSRPAVTVLGAEGDLSDFQFSEGEVLIVGAVKDLEGDKFKVLSTVADTLRDEFSFIALTEDNTLFKSFETKGEFVLMRDEEVVYTGEVNAEDLTKFIKSESFPLVGEIGPSNYKQYRERGLPFVWVFVDPDNKEEFTGLMDTVKTVAASAKGELSFVWLSGVLYKQHAEDLGASGNVPSLVLADDANRKKYVFEEDKEFNAENLQQFVDDFKAGKLVPKLKSEPIPESNDGPVTVIVGKTWTDIVLDETKDVLVEYYAPWCGHCKALAPQYETLGEMFQDNDNVVIGKVDSTANDVPEEIQGFPTIIFYPAGKTETITYKGDRTAEAIAEFVKANAGTENVEPKVVEDADAEEDKSEL